MEKGLFYIRVLYGACVCKGDKRYMDKIKNEAQLEVELCGKKHAIEAPVNVVHPVKIVIEREEPCNFVLENENIRYVFKVKNLSKVAVKNCMFKSELDANCEFVCGSFTINGRRHKACVRGNMVEAEIHELGACQTLEIAFEVKVKRFGHSHCGRHHHCGDHCHGGRPGHGGRPSDEEGSDLNGVDGDGDRGSHSGRPDGGRPDGGRPEGGRHDHRGCNCGERGRFVHPSSVQ